MKRMLVLLVALFVAAGCDSGSGGGAGGGGAGGDGGSGGSGGSDVDPRCIVPDDGPAPPPDGADSGWTAQLPASFECPMLEVERPASCGDDYFWWSSVRGWVAAPGGHALPGALAQLCIHTDDKRFVCLKPEEADANGVYTIEPPDDLRCIERAAMRVLQPDSGRATIYCGIDSEQGPALILADPAVLPLLRPAVELPPEGDPEAWRDVVFDDGLVIDWQPQLYYTGKRGDYARLAARRIPTDAVGLCGEAPTLGGLYAFFPEAVIDPPGFGLSIPNTNGYQAGAKIDLLVLGSIDCRLHTGYTVPEGTWAKFGEATVSEDGTTIVSDEGTGLPCFTWLAYRLKE